MTSATATTRIVPLTANSSAAASRAAAEAARADPQPRSKAGRHFQRGYELAQAERRDEAIAEYRLAYAADPNQPFAGRAS